MADGDGITILISEEPFCSLVSIKIQAGLTRKLGVVNVTVFLHCKISLI